MELPDLYNAFEVHDANAIRNAFRSGVDPNMQVQGEPLVNKLIDMYLRSPKFKDCFRAFLDHGLRMEDKALQAVLADDQDSLTQLLDIDPSILQRKYTFNCTFTPLLDATLLHVCAEYGHVDFARVLIAHEADVNNPAGMDEHGFGGQSPIFHTVNQHANNSIGVLNLLLQHGADPAYSIKGIIWGKGYAWETYIPSVDPVSYAMMGLLRQFQRKEEDIYEVVGKLMKARYGLDYRPANMPNEYLKK